MGSHSSPTRRAGVATALGIDETAFVRANAKHAIELVTGFLDSERHVLIDMIQGDPAVDVSAWFPQKPQEFLTAIAMVACNLHEGYRVGLHPTSTTRPRWPTPSTSSPSPTAFSTRSAGVSRTKRRPPREE